MRGVSRAAGAVRAALRRIADVPKWALVAIVQAYRLLFGAWVGAACRFEPSCSRYALQALQRHGALGGSVWTAWRLLRCHPGCAGGHDPVPDNLPWRRASRAAAALVSPPPATAGSGLFTRWLEPPAADCPTAPTSPDPVRPEPEHPVP